MLRGPLQRQRGVQVLVLVLDLSLCLRVLQLICTESRCFSYSWDSPSSAAPPHGEPRRNTGTQNTLTGSHPHSWSGLVLVRSWFWFGPDPGLVLVLVRSWSWSGPGLGSVLVLVWFGPGPGLVLDLVLVRSWSGLVWSGFGPGLGSVLVWSGFGLFWFGLI